MGQGASVLAEAAQELSTRVDVIEMQDEEFWSRFWPKDQALTYDQMYKAFTADALREVRSKCPKNLATLIRRAIATLAAHTRQGAVASKEARVQVGNLVRLLTRVIPIIFEDPTWEDFWLTSTPVGVNVTLPEGSIADAYNKGCPENIREEAVQQRQADLAAAEMPTNPPPPLYEVLLTAIQDLLLAPDYTALRNLPRAMPFGASPPQSHRPLAAVHGLDLTWYPGVEASTASVEKPSFVERRCELLRLLIACLCRPLYYPHARLDVRADPWASFIVSGAHRNTLVLARSLLNAVCTYDPIGYGMPYNYVMVPDDDRDKLAQLSGEVLCLLLDFVPYPQSGDPEGANHGTNIYIDWIASLKTEKDLDTISDNFARLLNNPLQGSYLPASFKHVDMHHELITLFWRISETNRHFVSRTLRTGKVLEILLPVLYRLNENKNVPGQVGFVHICVYTLLLLSGQRNFSVRLNKEWDASVRFEGIPFSNGNYADLMIMVLHAVLTTNNRRLTSLYELILTIIVNISPFVKRLSLQSANKLVHLFQVFSSRKYLFASEPNHRLVFFLLEAFNNLVQYQFEGNQHLVYCIIRRRALFYDLSALTIAREREDASASEAEEQAAPTQEEQRDDGSDNDDGHDEDDDAEEGEAEAQQQPEVPEQQPEVPEQQPGEAPNAVDPKHKLPPHAKHPEYPADKQAEVLNVYAPEKPVSDAPPKKQRAMIKTTLARNDPAEHFTVAEEVKEADTSDKQQAGSGADEENAVQATRSGWQPTQEWLDTWFPHLPLQTIQRLLKVLVPQVEKLCSDKGVTHEVEVIEFLKNGTLVGLLPVPHPIITRRYQGSGRSSIWFTSYFWSVIFLKNLTPPFLFDTDVKLFAVKVVE